MADLKDARIPRQGRGGPPTVVSVVGGRGFIGSRICSALRERGHVVEVFCRDEPPLTLDGLDPRVAASQHVVWAASSINPMIAANDPDRVALDTEFFNAFLQAVAAHEDGPRTILLSSGGTVYDTSVFPPYAETSNAEPATTYGRAKLGLEQLLLETDPRGLTLRISNAYGPHQPVAPGQGVIAHWLNAIAAGQDVHIFGDPMIARDYVHVDDVARAVCTVVERDYRGTGVLNVGAGVPTTLLDLLAAVAEATGDASLTPRLHPARPFDAPSTWLDCSRAMRDLGWEPHIDLVDGVGAAWHAVLQATLAAGVADPALQETT